MALESFRELFAVIFYKRKTTSTSILHHDHQSKTFNQKSKIIKKIKNRGIRK
jgi:hypothetical protein